MTALATIPDFDVGTEIARVNRNVEAIQHLIKEHMKEGVHYAIIAPGEKRGGSRSSVGGLDNRPKHSLLKPGAELLCMMFKLSPEYEYTVNDLKGGHREYVFTCTIRHGGSIIGQGVGSCSSQEVKYRYRGGWEKTDKPIPREYNELKKNGDFKKISALLGGPEYAVRQVDGEWCVARKGEKVENPDIADTFNTVLKMAKKRAMVDAILTATAASSVFTQDLADDLENLDDLPEPDDVPGEATNKGSAPKPPTSQSSDPPPKSPPASEADKAGVIGAFGAKGVSVAELCRIVGGKPVADWSVTDIAYFRDEYKRRGFAKKADSAPPATEQSAPPQSESPSVATPAADPLAELRRRAIAALESIPEASRESAKKAAGITGIATADENKLNVFIAVAANFAADAPAANPIDIINACADRIRNLGIADKPAWVNKVMACFAGTFDWSVPGKVPLTTAMDCEKHVATLEKLCERRRPKAMDDWIQAAESIVNGDSPAQEPWA